MKLRIGLCVLVSFVTASAAVPANGYDMDCKVILCLAGGFPQGCADARTYMLNRLRSFPPQPPFGYCSGGDPSGFQVYRGREPLLPCANDFHKRNPHGRIENECCCSCVATTMSASEATRLSIRAAEADGGNYSNAAVQPPSREEGRNHYLVHYACRRRPKPNWLVIRIRSQQGDWFLSERFGGNEPVVPVYSRWFSVYRFRSLSASRTAAERTARILGLIFEIAVFRRAKRAAPDCWLLIAFTPECTSFGPCRNADSVCWQLQSE